MYSTNRPKLVLGRAVAACFEDGANHVYEQWDQGQDWVRGASQAVPVRVVEATPGVQVRAAGVARGLPFEHISLGCFVHEAIVGCHFQCSIAGTPIRNV